MGLSDGGAHAQFICDARCPTFLLSHFARRRTRGPRFAVDSLVRRLTRDPAELYGFDDRGVLAVGKRADVNVIDPASLAPCTPRLTDDLPSGAHRFVQDATGYDVTIVAGTVTRRNGRHRRPPGSPPPSAPPLTMRGASPPPARRGGGLHTSTGDVEPPR
ncbi:hypothetical protein GCM10023175_35730 [Pseudonocardia xishanensis]|uniref:Amidohydrolase 3 domain-containing protein n=2 Tax=Pseudonocardia xishanensis TaxID=630995 RepID=A0ABP8RVB1_9PSEU